jgi:hypothetical protein
MPNIPGHKGNTNQNHIKAGHRWLMPSYGYSGGRDQEDHGLKPAPGK